MTNSITPERAAELLAMDGFTEGPWEPVRYGMNDVWCVGTGGWVSQPEFEDEDPYFDDRHLCEMTGGYDDSEVEMDAHLIAAAPDLHALARQQAAEIERLRDTVDGLDSELTMAVETAFRRGAVEWTRLNYPDQYAALAATYTPGHTDMMVPPESLDVWLEGNPLPAPQPDADEREAMVYLIERTLQEHPAQHESAWHRAHYVADALLAAGWTRKREEG